MQYPFALFFYKLPKYFLSSWIHVIQSCSRCFVHGPNCCLRFSFYFDPLVSKRLLIAALHSCFDFPLDAVGLAIYILLVSLGIFYIQVFLPLAFCCQRLQYLPLMKLVTIFNPPIVLQPYPTAFGKFWLNPSLPRLALLAFFEYFPAMSFVPPTLLCVLGLSLLSSTCLPWS